MSRLARGYPRPQLRRADWASLNGTWEFALDHEARWRGPEEFSFDGSIRVPFSPETPASGVGDTGLYRACWYRRTFRRPTLRDGARLILHFGAVDHAASIWVNGLVVTRHLGGYTPFQVDITEALGPDPQTIVVRAEDDPHDLAKPRGKQDWLAEPHSIWYHRTSGIWQTVWLERLPATWIDSLRWTPNLERWEIGLEATAAGAERDDVRLRARLSVGDQLLADDTYRVLAGEVSRRIALSDPGIDDYRNALLWSPSCPTLIEAELELLDRHGRRVDVVRSYTALRSIALQGDRFLLNGRPQELRFVLDQGYWPEGGLTAPDDGALRRDVELARQMGFNGVRKHQKIEDPRYLYWADRLGLMVWGEMPSAYRFTGRSIECVLREWQAAIKRDISHPCIVAWVPLNESWGVPDLPAIAAQRHYVQALYHLTKTLDPDRPVIGNDGWESVATDIVGIHDYDGPEDLERRYAGPESIPNLFTRERPGGRLLSLQGDSHAGQPIMLTEFGGISLTRGPDPGSWGYGHADSVGQFAERFERLLGAAHASSLLAGFCYTQFADTYQEVNGLLYADRTPKLPPEEIARFVLGTRTSREQLMDREAYERGMRCGREWDIRPPDDPRGRAPHELGRG